MFDGRHCIYKDLELLRKETQKVKEHLSDEVVVDKYLRLIERFDKDIAGKMRLKIKNFTPEIVLKTIEQNIEILEQNIIVDINEHK